MQASQRLTRSELLQRYPDKDLHERLFRLRCIADFLRFSIVDDDYDVPMRLVAPIRLTPEGHNLQRRLLSNTNPRNACILAIFLTLWWDDLLVDPVTTKLDDVIAAVSDELGKGRIRHPYLFGRILYERAFEQLAESKRILDKKETDALLVDTPAGVFQLADYISGPYGLITGTTQRFFPPDYWVPLYHCEDLSCSRLHQSALTTGKSKVSKIQTRLREILERRCGSPSDWESLLKDVAAEMENPFSWTYSAGLIPLLGDSFSLKELRLIVADLLNSTEGQLRRGVSSLGLQVADAESFVVSLSEAECLQLILLCDDSQISDALDCLILDGRIHIPATEVRRSIVKAEYSGYFSIQPECSSLGIRFHAGKSLTLLRIRHLITSLFDTSDERQRERLEWLIRGAEGETFHERLDHFICYQDFEEVIRTLSFDSHKNMEIAAGFAGIGRRAIQQLADDESSLSRAISWRLGVADATDNDRLAKFQQHGDGLRQLAMRTHKYSPSDEEDIRSIAANFFVALEGLLSDYIKLATWALVRDHYASPDGFVYHIEEATGFCASTIAPEQPNFTLTEDGKWTLAPLIHSYGALARVLAGLSREGNMRPEHEYPHILRNSSPYIFPFRHRHPFLDLSEDSRMHILSILKEATKKLSSGKVDEIRNLIQHSSRRFPTQAELLTAISAAEVVISEAEEAGFLPVAAFPLEHRHDSFGRQFVSLGTSRGKATEFIRPSQQFLAGLPALGSPQLIVRSAVYEDSSEVIRLSIRHLSAYAERWGNYPRRRVAQPGRVSGDAGTVLET